MQKFQPSEHGRFGGSAKTRRGSHQRNKAEEKTKVRDEMSGPSQQGGASIRPVLSSRGAQRRGDPADTLGHSAFRQFQMDCRVGSRGEPPRNDRTEMRWQVAIGRSIRSLIDYHYSLLTTHYLLLLDRSQIRADQGAEEFWFGPTGIRGGRVLCDELFAGSDLRTFRCPLG